MKSNVELLFVYNADSGIFAGIKDLVHKSVSPKTYGCNLCALTYKGISMKNEWKEFIASLPIKTSFFHKDAFVKLYPKYKVAFCPVVFRKEGEKLTKIISASEINKLVTLEGLQNLVTNKLASL